MNFEPQKFFIGLIDFFSILLPGALFTYLLKDYIGPSLHPDYSKIAGTEGWIIFLFSSYLLGHFIFLLGSWLLDDHVYDPIRTATYSGQIRRLAEGRPLPWKLTRRFAGWLIPMTADRTVREAVRIKEHYLDPLGASSAINAFQWSKAKLMLDHSRTMETVQRFEADSKFFRSLFIVLAVLLPVTLIVHRPVIALISALFMLLAFWRYVDQRTKSTTQAYWYIITAEAQAESGYRRQLPDQIPYPSHAGGVVYRPVREETEYLLVQAQDSQDWVLPKGHIEAGEPMQETAVREVREESGVWACIEDELKIVSYTVGGANVQVQFYLMRKVEEGASLELRKPTWLSYDEALGRATHWESKELLRLAEQKRIQRLAATAARKAMARP